MFGLSYEGEDAGRCFRYTDEGKVLIGLQFVKKNKLTRPQSVCLHMTFTCDVIPAQACTQRTLL